MYAVAGRIAEAEASVVPSIRQGVEALNYPVFACVEVDDTTLLR
jgi:hypothetical protein